MQVLFLTLVKINSLNERGIYTDLLRKFSDEGHTVTVVCPTERREKNPTTLIQEGLNSILKVKTFNLQKTNVIEKGIGTLAIEYQFLNAIKKHLKSTKFDLVVYSTPPITFSKVIQFIKNRDNAYAYLLLKDIFPQNAIDMQLMKENSFLHKLFIKKEKKLYAISDTIGCMSPANKNYILKHNPEIDSSKVEVNPNTIQPIEFNLSLEEKDKIKEKYGLPLDRKIFVYGGNLGIPQGLDFLLETIIKVKNENAFFLIVGSGTMYSKMEEWFLKEEPSNAKLLAGLPKTDYDNLLGACDIGLIFLNKNFTIPNFPSRLLSYLEMKMPVVAATDDSTDIGQIIEKQDCGKWVLSGDLEKINEIITTFTSFNSIDFEQKRKNAYQLLEDKYLVEYSYNLILNKVKNV
jgi:glycosyltransferase involved in cell wall biosynthesis